MYLVLFILVFAHPIFAQFESVDDVFESYIGKFHDHRTFTPKTLIDSQDIRMSEDFLNSTHTKVQLLNNAMRLSKPEDQVTPQPMTPPMPDVPLQHLKQRLRMIYLKKLVETDASIIPDFSNNGDDPAIITRRFENINKQLRQQKKSDLRQLYHDDWPDIPRIQKEKNKTLNLMAHFVYATRYKLPYLQLLRDKYKHLHKYKIGYCFGLMRTLVDQQHIIYSSLHFYNMNFTNLMIHMKLYEKVVRIDVDIQDLAKYIRVLNYRRHMAASPEYYDDNSEELKYARKQKQKQMILDAMTTPSQDGPSVTTSTTSSTTNAPPPTI